MHQKCTKSRLPFTQLFPSLYPNWCWFQYPSETVRITVLSPLFRTRNTMQASMRGERERNVVVRTDLVLIGTICDRLWSDAKNRDVICSWNGSSRMVAESVGSLHHGFVSSMGVHSRWWSEVKVGEGRNEGLPRWSSKPTNFWEEPRAGQGGVGGRCSRLRMWPSCEMIETPFLGPHFAARYSNAPPLHSSLHSIWNGEAFRKKCRLLYEREMHFP